MNDTANEARTIALEKEIIRILDGLPVSQAEAILLETAYALKRGTIADATRIIGAAFSPRGPSKPALTDYRETDDPTEGLAAWRLYLERVIHFDASDPDKQGWIRHCRCQLAALDTKRGVCAFFDMFEEDLARRKACRPQR